MDIRSVYRNKQIADEYNKYDDFRISEVFELINSSADVGNYDTQKEITAWGEDSIILLQEILDNNGYKHSITNDRSIKKIWIYWGM